MATATLKFIASNKSVLGDVTQDCVAYRGTITFSAAGDTYATGGIAALAGFALANLGPYGNRAPLDVRIFSQVGQSWDYQWNFSTAKLQVFTGNSSGSATTSSPELTNATALNATTPTISTDVVGFVAVFPKSIS